MTRRGPQKLTPSALAEAIGIKGARIVIERFGRKRIPGSLGRVERNLAIIADVDAGDTYAEVAARYGITRQAVAKIASSSAAGPLTEEA